MLTNIFRNVGQNFFDQVQLSKWIAGYNEIPEAHATINLDAPSGEDNGLPKLQMYAYRKNEKISLR